MAKTPKSFMVFPSCSREEGITSERLITNTLALKNVLFRFARILLAPRFTPLQVSLG